MTNKLDEIEMNRLTPDQITEIGQMQRLLLEVGYSPEFAYYLYVDEGIDASKLKEILKTKKLLAHRYGVGLVQSEDDVVYCVMAVSEKMIEDGTLFYGTKTSEQIYKKVAQFSTKKEAKEYLSFLREKENTKNIYFLARGRFVWHLD